MTVSPPLPQGVASTASGITATLMSVVLIPNSPVPVFDDTNTQTGWNYEVRFELVFQVYDSIRSYTKMVRQRVSLVQGSSQYALTDIQNGLNGGWVTQLISSVQSAVTSLTGS